MLQKFMYFCGHFFSKFYREFEGVNASIRNEY